MAQVLMGSVDMGQCEVIPALDTTLTIKFEQGDKTISKLDKAFRSLPNITTTEEDGTATTFMHKKLQAYRIEASGHGEVSFMADSQEVVDNVES